jgi:hypothetical protein
MRRDVFKVDWSYLPIILPLMILPSPFLALDVLLSGKKK